MLYNAIFLWDPDTLNIDIINSMKESSHKSRDCYDWH